MTVQIRGRMGRVLRIVITVVVAFAAWLVTSPARADVVRSLSAPQCDARGATTFAPTPHLETPLVSLDMGVQDDDCFPHMDLETYRQGRAPSPDPSQAVPETTLSPGLRVSAAAPSAMANPPRYVFVASRGVIGAIERPPRLSS
jgi:hypothetical protein